MLRSLPIQPLLDLLDEGLRLYRRGFVRFVTISALGLVPLAIGLGLVIASGAYYSEGPLLLGLLVWLPLSMLVLVVAAGAMSRSAIALRSGEPLGLWAALRFGPGRTLGMGCFSLVFLFVANVASSIFSCICLIPFYAILFGSAFGVGGLFESEVFGVALAALFGALVIIGTLLFYGFSLVLGGATYCSFVYGLQPFAQEQLGIGAAIGQSVDMLFYRFGRNLLAFSITSLAFASMAGVVTIAAAVLIPLPISFALGPESPISYIALSSAWLLGLAAALPLLPIWMAIYYRDNADRREGADLARRIEELH
jgi:hypothetical protein